MEELSKRYAQLLKMYALLSFMHDKFLVAQKAMHTPHPRDNTENIMVLHRDALIKRFELSYDATWKYFKLVLRQQYGVEVASPRMTFQECRKQGILTETEADALIGMIHDRNELVHVYDEAVADTMSHHIINFYPILVAIIQKSQPGQ